MACSYCSADNTEGDILLGMWPSHHETEKSYNHGKYRIDGTPVYYLAQNSVEIIDELKDVIVFSSAQ